MVFDDDLLNLILKSPNSMKIKAIAEQLEIDHNFSFSTDRNDLKGVWELRICKGDKRTLFVLRKINSPTLFKNFKEFIKIY